MITLNLNVQIKIPSFFIRVLDFSNVLCNMHVLCCNASLKCCQSVGGAIQVPQLRALLETRIEYDVLNGKE